MEAFDLDKTLETLMDTLARPAIAIQRPYPPPAAPVGRSKLGGLPTLPPTLDWPYGRCTYGSARGRVPLHFMAQIDCSELPRIDRPGAWPALPDSGMLYFFANMHVCPDWEHSPPDDYRRVLYAPQVAPEQAPRRPPADIPVIGDEWPGGYADAHRGDDPLTHRIYFEWPIRFAVIDTYPATDAASTTPAWAAVAAAARRRAERDAAFRAEFGGDVGLLDVYGDAIHDRMRRNLYEALAIEPPPRSDTRVPGKPWRTLATPAGAPFPPTAVFGAAIAGAIQSYVQRNIEHISERYARRPEPIVDILAMIDGLGERLRRGLSVISSRRSTPKPAPPLPLPDWIKDLCIVADEAGSWLAAFRALPADAPIPADQRERFLAWMDALDDGQWARIDGHRPEMATLADPFSKALFRLIRLSAARLDIRADLSDAAYRRFAQEGQPARGFHQMLGWFRSSQASRPVDDPMVPLLMLNWDECPDFQIGDVGEMQFFIGKRDLAIRDFSRVEMQMQGG